MVNVRVRVSESLYGRGMGTFWVIVSVRVTLGLGL